MPRTATEPLRLKLTKCRTFMRADTKTARPLGIRWATLELANPSYEQSVAFEKFINAINNPQSEEGQKLEKALKRL